MTTRLSLDQFIGQLATLRTRLHAAEHRGLERAGQIIEDEAKAEIGRYQRENMGPFADWDELADRTKADRVSKGFPENNPLLRSGELLHSISHEVEGSVVTVGSPLDIAVYQEFGTIHAAHPIPPRAFLGTAAFRKGKAAAQAIGLEVAHVVAGMAPTRP